MQIINSPNVTLPAGHYSHGTVAGGLVFVSGQLPFALNSQELPIGITAQTIQALKNVEAVLLACGSSMKQLVNVQIFIADVALWPEVNLAYSNYLQSSKPARTIVPCGHLHYGALVEINAVAEINSCTK